MKHLLDNETQLKLYEELNRKVNDTKDHIKNGKMENAKEYLDNIEEILKIQLLFRNILLEYQADLVMKLKKLEYLLVHESNNMKIYFFHLNLI